MAGGLIGWAVRAVMRTQEDLMLNVRVGIVVAALGGWFLRPLVGASSINQGNFSAANLVASFLGAVVLLAVINIVRRGAPR